MFFGKVDIGFRWESQKDKDHYEDSEGGRIILKLISHK
jgi:hypothetical protein